MRASTKKVFDNIVDIFSCADGGVDLVTFKCSLEDIDNRAKNGDSAAEQLIDVVQHFNRLATIFSNKPLPDLRDDD